MNINDVLTDGYVVIGKSGCKYCVKAIEFLERAETEYVYIDIKDINMDSLQKVNKNWKTVPQIFLRKDFIGGFSELEKRFEFKNSWRHQPS